MQRRPRRVAKLLFTQPSHQSGLDFVNKRVVFPQKKYFDVSWYLAMSQNPGTLGTPKIAG